MSLRIIFLIMSCILTLFVVVHHAQASDGKTTISTQTKIFTDGEEHYSNTISRDLNDHFKVGTGYEYRAVSKKDDRHAVIIQGSVKF